MQRYLQCKQEHVYSGILGYDFYINSAATTTAAIHCLLLPSAAAAIHRLPPPGRNSKRGAGAVSTSLSLSLRKGKATAIYGLMWNYPHLLRSGGDLGGVLGVSWSYSGLFGRHGCCDLKLLEQPVRFM
jgi:hypothetical protein